MKLFSKILQFFQITLLSLFVTGSALATLTRDEVVELRSIPDQVDKVLRGTAAQCYELGKSSLFKEEDFLALPDNLKAEVKKFYDARVALFRKLERYQNLFSEEYLEAVGRAKRDSDICKKPSGFKELKKEERKKRCDEAKIVVQNYQDHKGTFEKLLAEIIKSNVDFDSLLLKVRDAGARARTVYENDPFVKVADNPYLMKELDERIKKHHESYLAFVEKSVVAFHNSHTQWQKIKSFDDHSIAVSDLAESPFLSITSTSINEKLTSRSKKLLNLQSGRGVIAFNLKNKEKAFTLSSQHIRREFEVQELNVKEALFLQLKHDQVLERSIKLHGEPYTIKSIKDQLAKYAWVRDFVKSYHSEGVSQVPNSILLKGCEKANAIAGTNVCQKGQKWDQKIDKYLQYGILGIDHDLTSKENKGNLKILVCTESSMSLRDAQLDYVTSMKRQLGDIISQLELEQEDGMSHKQFHEIMSVQLPIMASRLSESLGLGKNSKLFDSYLEKLSKKDVVDPDIEMSIVHAIASNFAVEQQKQRAESCRMFSRLEEVQVRADEREVKPWLQACEEARKLNESWPACPPNMEYFGSFLAKITKSFRDAITSAYNRIKRAIKTAVGKLEEKSKVAYNRALGLVQDFVAITSRVANATSQVVFTGSIDWDETNENMGVSRWFNSTTDGLSELGEKILEGSAKGGVKLVKTYVSYSEAVINFAQGDKDSAKRALKRGKANAKDTVRHVGKTGEAAVKAYYVYTIEAPLKLGTNMLDSATGSKLEDEYDEARKKVSKELKKGSKKVGDVLEVTIQPENLGKIAFVYAASYVGGPFGSSLANVLYDKIVLKKDMSDDDMFKSFAVGAAAGYAGEAAGGAFDSAYANRVASSLANSTTRDVGDAVANGKKITAKGILKNVGSAVVSVNTGAGVGNKILDETINSALNSATDQAVDNGFRLDQIDLNRVEQAAIQGFASGLTREAVHKLMDETLIKAIPNGWKRLDKQAFKKLKEEMYVAFKAIQKATIESYFEFVDNLNEERKQKFTDLTRQLIEESLEEAAKEVFGKSLSELTEEELASSKLNQVSHYEMLRRAQNIQGQAGLKDFGEQLFKLVQHDVIGMMQRRSASIGKVAFTIFSFMSSSTLFQYTTKLARGTDYRGFLNEKLKFIEDQLAAQQGGYVGSSDAKRVKGISKKTLEDAKKLIIALKQAENEDLGDTGLDTVYGKYSPVDISRRGRKANKGLDIANVITDALTQSGYGDKLNKAMKALHNMGVIDAYEEKLSDPDYDYEIDDEKT